MPLQLPSRIGKYDLQEFLGGGMSHVYRARDTVMERTVAIKILTEEGCADPEAKARFLQEARMAGKLGHENVISIYDFGEDEQKRPFMVMEFLQGEDLKHAIAGGRIGTLHDMLRIALQVARAIGFIHSQKIIHRDIKPENIYLTPKGIVKLMDFGIAKTEGFSMTRAGYVMGTPYYMSPEQVLGKDVGDAADIYAFGILFFELLSGTKPVTGDTIERIFYSILNEPLNMEPLHGVPHAVCDLIARCTAKDPALRPPSFDQIAQEIDAILAPLDAAGEATASTTSPPARKALAARSWLMLGAAALVLLIAIGAAVGYFVSRGGHPAEPAKQQSTATAPALPATLATSTGVMDLVPAGQFLAGKDLEPVTLPAFYVDHTEVRNADYESFCRATGHALPRDFPAGKPDYPIVNISIDEARQYAHWADKRLPSSHEWEKAARGVDGGLFPWGKGDDPMLANVKNNPTLTSPGTVPVNSFEKGASPFHALQMVGNVWEFVDEPSQPSPELVASYAHSLHPPPTQQEPWYRVRGGSYREPLSGVEMSAGVTVPARWKDPTVGFRCIKEVPAR